MKWHRTEVRLPLGLHEAISENACLSGRTLNGQIIFVLSWWLTSADAEEARLYQEQGMGFWDDEHARSV